MVMPRYQRAGIRIAGMPQVSTSGLEASARANETLSQNLDRISNFAFQQAGIQAEQEGKEYGALNAPTREQLQDAVSQGQDPSTLLPGDDKTIFGRAARGTALNAMALQFETEARREIVNLQAQFENEEINLVDLESSFNSLVSQQTEILSQVSPQTAQKFSASIGVVTNSAYLSAAKTQAERDKDAYEIQLRTEVGNFGKYAETIVKAGPIVSEDGSVISVDDRVNTLKSELVSITQEIGNPALAQFAIENFDNEVRQAKIDVVMDYALRNPQEAMSVLLNRTSFQDSELQAVYESMDLETQNEVFNSINTALENADARRRRQDQFNDEQHAKNVTELQAQIQNAMLNNNRDQAEDLLQELYSIDLTAYNNSYEAFRATPGFDNVEAIRELTVLKLNNQLTREAINVAFTNGDLSQATFNRFVSNLDTQNDTQEQEANRFVRNALDLPNAPAWSYNDKQRNRLRYVNQIENKLIIARNNALAKGEDFDPLEFVQQEVEKVIEEIGDVSVNLDEASQIYNAILLDNPEISSPTEARIKIQNRDLFPGFGVTERAAYVQYMEALEEERRKQGEM